MVRKAHKDASAKTPGKTFPTGVLWKVVTGQTSSRRDAENLADTMYPGINFWSSALTVLISEVMKPDLRALHPKLAEAATEAEAIELLGEKIRIKEVKKCDGYQWENDPAWKAALPGQQKSTAAKPAASPAP